MKTPLLVWIPVLKTKNSDQCLDFYVNGLGFRHSTKTHLHQGRAIEVSLGRLILHLVAESSLPIDRIELLVFVSNIDIRHTHISRKLPDFTTPVTSLATNLREFRVTDHDGHMIRFVGREFAVIPVDSP
jgi:hypothetical protein